MLTVSVNHVVKRFIEFDECGTTLDDRFVLVLLVVFRKIKIAGKELLGRHCKIFSAPEILPEFFEPFLFFRGITAAHMQYGSVNFACTHRRNNGIALLHIRLSVRQTFIRQTVGNQHRAFIRKILIADGLECFRQSQTCQRSLCKPRVPHGVCRRALIAHNGGFEQYFHVPRKTDNTDVIFAVHCFDQFDRRLTRNDHARPILHAVRNIHHDGIQFRIVVSLSVIDGQYLIQIVQFAVFFTVDAQISERNQICPQSIDRAFKIIKEHLVIFELRHVYIGKHDFIVSAQFPDRKGNVSVIDVTVYGNRISVILGNLFPIRFGGSDQQHIQIIGYRLRKRIAVIPIAFVAFRFQHNFVVERSDG